MKIPTIFALFVVPFSFIRAQDQMNPAALPKIPRGCFVHVYGPITSAPSYLPKEATSRSDWTGFFKSAGVLFAKGGFSYFYQPSKTLIIATSKSDFELIETVMSSSPGHKLPTSR